MQDSLIIMQNSKSHIAVLLFDQFSNHCLANAIEPLRAANTLSDKEVYSWDFRSLEGGVVTSSSGLPVQTEPLGQSKRGAALFVMPSYGFKQAARDATRRALIAAQKRYELIVGLDMGAWLLADAGLLDGRRATIHWEELDQFAETFPEVEVEPARFIFDQDIATSAGAAAAMEFALHLIERNQGAMLRLDVAGLLMHGERRDFKNRDFRPTGDQLVDGAVAVMRRKLETLTTIEAIASAVGLNQRQLEHVFDEKLKTTPQSVYKTLRLNEAARLIKSTRFNIAEIAIRSGYSDASAMTRAFREQFGMSPSKYRKESGG